jgi:hypothetical protein
MLMHLAQLEVRLRSIRILKCQFSKPKSGLLVLLSRFAISAIVESQVSQVLHGVNVGFLR